MIEKILTYLNSIPSDKVAHALGGVILFAIGELFGLGILLVIVGAVGKEIYDYFNKENHTPDAWDAVATIAGGLLGYIIQGLS
jgi:hypothetical protein